jgi:tetratricopeptide (TPR) repeat protein
LSKILSVTDRRAEAVDVLEKAVRLSPNSSALQTALASAYLRNKQTEQGLALIKRAVAVDRNGYIFNEIAYSLAEMNVELDLAKEYGEKALERVEAESLRADDNNAGLSTAQNFVAFWDTVGWIYFRRGEYQKAVSYLRASWVLSQRAIVGDHLGQVYEKLGMKREALHIYKLALASTSQDPKEELRQHYEELSGQKSVSADVSTPRRGAHGVNPSPEEELSRMRTIKLVSSPHESANAVFTVVFSGVKIDAVKFVSGSEKLKTMASQIASAKFKVELPDSHPLRLFRRGLLVCGKITGCDLALLLPDSVHAFDQNPIAK